MAGWPTYGADPGGRRYSPLEQIRPGNAEHLEEAWRIRTGDLDAEPSPPRHMAFQATPILVEGLLVLPTPLGRILALAPHTGEEAWRFDATLQGREYPEFTSRGVAAWRDPAAAPGALCGRRIFAATVESRLFALDAATGALCAGFGTAGEVDLREGVGELRPWDYTISSPPVVVEGLVVVGSAIGDNQRVEAPRGVVRAYDVRTGGEALLREFAPMQRAPFGVVREPVLSPLLLPCNPPPWGTLTAISLDTGDILWRSPLGTVPGRIPVPVPVDFGLPNLGGPIATTGGLVFIGAAMDGYLRAYDLATGEELWKDRLPTGGNATPMTYRLSRNGRQYVVIAAGGHGKLGTRRGDHVVAYALPGGSDR